jgi:hypothetical protein
MLGLEGRALTHVRIRYARRLQKSACSTDAEVIEAFRDCIVADLIHEPPVVC